VASRSKSSERARVAHRLAWTTRRRELRTTTHRRGLRVRQQALWVVSSTPLIRSCQRGPGAAGQRVTAIRVAGHERRAALEPFRSCLRCDRERQRRWQDGQGSSSRTGARGQRPRAAMSGRAETRTVALNREALAGRVTCSLADKLAEPTPLSPAAEPASANCADPKRGAHIEPMMPSSRRQARRRGR